MKQEPHIPLVFAVYPTTRGFAFVLFQSLLSPYDWGVRSVRHRDKNTHSLRAISDLIKQYRPDVVVIEDTSSKGSRRSSRIRRLYRSISAFAEGEGIEVYGYDRDAIRVCFAQYEARSKYEIAKVIALHIEEFSHRLPPKRKIWQAEDGRQSLFDAASLALCFYAVHGHVFGKAP